MGKYAQLVMGPAGSGKSTYCHIMQQHCENKQRLVHVVNLDPAADGFRYTASLDIRDLISLDDVMEECQLGPNGGLLYCMEYLIENMDWFRDEIDDYADDYLILDCAGQIELYMHVPVMRILVAELVKQGYHVTGVYCIDSTFVEDTSKYIAGTMMALSAMTHLEIPHVNVMTKCDLLLVSRKGTAKPEDDDYEKYFEQHLIPDPEELATQLNPTNVRFKQLNQAITSLIGQFSMVQFVPLNVEDQDSIEYVLSLVDQTLQYGEDEEPKDPDEHQDPNDFEELQLHSAD